MSKTSKKDFEIFKAECVKWIGIFGLVDWEIEFYHEDLGKGILAKHDYNEVSRFGNIRFGLDWGDYKIIPQEVRKTAFHEVSEFRLCKLRDLAKSRFIREEEIDEEIHAIVHILENVLWEDR